MRVSAQMLSRPSSHHLSSRTMLFSSSSPLSFSFAPSSQLRSGRVPTWLCLLCVYMLVSLPLLAGQSCNPCSGGCGGFDVSSLTKEYSAAARDYGSTYYLYLCKNDNKCSTGGQPCMSTFEGTYYSLGDNANAVWALNSPSNLTQGATLTVTGGHDSWDECSNGASSTVNVICGTGDDSLQAVNENVNCKWSFTLNSAYVCTLTASSGGSSAGKGLSGGSIFLILFFVGAFVYLVGGILFNKYKRGLSGSELIPNIGFWRDLPGLVKDGCVFSFNKVRALCGGGRTGSLLSKGTGSTYETI